VNNYYIFVDESYDNEVFVLGVVWVRSLKEVIRIKGNALKVLGKKDHNFHYSDDNEKIKSIFLTEILLSPVNYGIVLFKVPPKTCREYAKYYVSDIVRVLPLTKSLLNIYVKGLKYWISKSCNILAEAAALGIENENAVRLRLNFNKEERAGLEVADYIASTFRMCIRTRFEFCDELSSKVKFIYRV